MDREMVPGKAIINVLAVCVRFEPESVRVYDLFHHNE